MSLVQGKADPMNLFMSGKLTLDGDMGLAMKLEEVLKPLGEKLRAKL